MDSALAASSSRLVSDRVSRHRHCPLNAGRSMRKESRRYAAKAFGGPRARMAAQEGSFIRLLPREATAVTTCFCRCARLSNGRWSCAIYLPKATFLSCDGGTSGNRRVTHVVMCRGNWSRKNSRRPAEPVRGCSYRADRCVRVAARIALQCLASTRTLAELV